MLNNDILFSIAQYLEPKDKHSLFLTCYSLSKGLYFDSEWVDYYTLFVNGLKGFNRWTMAQRVRNVIYSNHADLCLSYNKTEEYYTSMFDRDDESTFYTIDVYQMLNEDKCNIDRNVNTHLFISLWDNLRYLAIRYSGLESIVLCNLPNLEEVCLNNNELESFSIIDCPLVKYLDLSNNRLKTVDVEHLKLLEVFIN
jgi:Leucine-rich repeat (LRR) protein